MVPQRLSPDSGVTVFGVSSLACLVSAQWPQNGGFLALKVWRRENARLNGGPGRTRTCNQTVMSGPL
jgi:hypothetical protein